MRAIDNYTDKELETLEIKGMLNRPSDRDHQPAPNKAQHSQWFGVYDTKGKLRATFDSEPEAYFYIRNRGHVNGGTYKEIESEGN